MLDDPDLSEKIRAGDRAALTAVVQTYLGQIVRAARGAGLDANRAEDVAQATFKTFFEKAKDFEGRSHIRTWLFGILYKKIAEAYRERQRDERMEDIDAVMEQRFDAQGRWARPPRLVEAEVYDAEVRERLNACLETVPTQQRLAFLLREVEGFTTQEICKILQVSRTNLGVLFYRARNRLRECLETQGVKGES